MRFELSELLSEAPAQQWIDAGWARHSERAGSSDLRSISFLEARAQALVHLTGEGAHMLDRTAKARASRRDR